MKRVGKVLAAFLVFCTVLCAMTLCSCAPNEPTQHEHKYSSEWTYDETYHWHKATCEHTTEINGKTQHSFDGDKCTVCSYEKKELVIPNVHVHSLIFVEAQSADCETTGNIEYYTCDGCDKYFYDSAGKNEISNKESVTLPAMGHTYATEWSCDNLSHWHEATCGHDIIKDSEKHILKDDICTVCAKKNYIEGLEFSFDSYYGCYVSGIGTVTEADIIIPRQYNGYPVKHIGSKAFKDCNFLNSITIPDSVTSIGDSTFAGCINLRNVTLPNSLYSIGNSAFFKCNNLRSIIIPSSVKSIGYAAFWVEVTFDNVNGIYIFNKWATKLTIYFESAELSFKRYDIAGHYVKIVLDCKNNDISIDGEIVYKDANSITYRLIKDNEEAMVWYADEDIEDVVIPSSITYKNTIYKVCSIDNCAFYCCYNLKRVEIYNGVTSIGASAFYGCSNLTSMEMSNSVTSIGDHAFYHCSNLVSAELSNNLTSLSDYIFKGCASLERINIPDCVKTIGKYAFAGCSMLSSVMIPNSVSTIKESAFVRCNSLTSIEIPKSVTSIKDCAFDGRALTLYCEVASKPNGWIYTYWYVSGQPVGIDKDWNGANCPIVWNCRNNDVANDGYVYAVIGGIRYKIKNDEAVVCGQPENITDINIPQTVEYKNKIYNVIFNDASVFSGCGLVESVSIADNAKYYSKGNCIIENGMYHNILVFGCKNSVIPDSVDVIGSAFRGCIGLTSIKIPNGVFEIGSDAFYGCSNLENIEIPDSMWYLKVGAFKDCSSLKQIYIPIRVESIGPECFSGCYNLTIYCERPRVHPNWFQDWNKCSDDSYCTVVWNYKNIWN